LDDVEDLFELGVSDLRWDEDQPRFVLGIERMQFKRLISCEQLANTEKNYKKAGNSKSG
jgi:hypothetical protein